MYKILEWFKRLFKNKEEPKDINKAVLDLEDKIKSFLLINSMTYSRALWSYYDYRLCDIKLIRNVDEKSSDLVVEFEKAIKFDKATDEDIFVIRITLDSNMKFLKSTVAITDHDNRAGTNTNLVCLIFNLKDDIVKNCIEKEGLK